MNPEKRQTKQEDTTAAIDFLNKAQDSHETMLLAFKNKNYNAVGTLAIQCAISSADAICVHEKGVRSISQDHGDVCDLLRSTLLPEANEKSNALKRILAKKILFSMKDVTYLNQKLCLSLSPLQEYLNGFLFTQKSKSHKIKTTYSDFKTNRGTSPI